MSKGVALGGKGYSRHSALFRLESIFQGITMVLIWRKHLSVGNAMLDFEHKSLIGMVNSIEYSINTKDSQALLEGMKLFKGYMDTHFSNEVLFAQAVNFHFEQHELVHQHLQKELQHTIDQLDVKAGAWSEYVMDYYSQFLRDWLIGHITSEDMLMKPVLQAHDYNFLPGGSYSCCRSRL